jgi:hypothetical protein
VNPQAPTVTDEQRERISLHILKNDVDSYLSELKGGEHGSLFYLSQEQRRRIQFRFIKTGLEQNWYCVYATAMEDLQSVEASMLSAGIDVNEHQKNDKDLLIVRGEELFGNAQAPDIARWLSSANNIYLKAIGNGKRGVRVAADLSAYFLKRGLVDQWFKLEACFGRRFSKELTILCAYDAFDIDYRVGKGIVDVMQFYSKLAHEKGQNRNFLITHSFAILPNSPKGETIFKLV